VTGYIIAGWIGTSVCIATAGRRYRFGFWGYLFGCLLLSPVIGFLLLAAAIPVRVKQPAALTVRERGSR
jgi:uncharacterized membrane protein